MRQRLLRVPWSPVAIACLSVLLGVLGRYAGANAPDVRLLPVLIFGVLLFGAVYVIEKVRPRRAIVRIGAPVIPRTQVEKDRQARAGLIAFVSMYNYFGKIKPSEEEKKRACDELDYAALDLMNSNLEPLIHAVLTHKSKLRHCWLIGTTSITRSHPGSSVYAPVVEKYLLKEHKLNCHFFHGPEYEVPLDDDGDVILKTHDLVRDIFQEAANLGLKPGDVVVDFTAGMRSLSGGALMACLDGQRDVELVGTHYDAAGNPIWHDLFTVIVPFDVIVPEEV